MTKGLVDSGTQRFSLPEADTPIANYNIKIVGVGGGGGNVVNHCAQLDFEGVELAAINTDVQALSQLGSSIERFNIGQEQTRGEGAGGDPMCGEVAATASLDTFKNMLQNTRLVFLVACMGGGTGTGAAPVLAKLARDSDVLTIGLVTTPFGYERRDKVAMGGIRKLREHAHAVLAVPNEQGEDELLLNAFKNVNDYFASAITAITDMLFKPGVINLDFKDLKNCVAPVDGRALDLFIGSGEATGEDRAVHAVNAALDTSRQTISRDHIAGNSAILYLTCRQDPEKRIGIGRKEMETITEAVRAYMAEEAQLVTGSINDQTLGEGLLRVTVIIPGESIPKLGTVAEQEEATAEVDAAPIEVVEEDYEEVQEESNLDLGIFVADETDADYEEPTEDTLEEAGVKVAQKHDLQPIPALFKKQAN